MKPISNFRDHRLLKYNEQKFVFVIKHSNKPEIYLFSEKEVRRILPIKIEYTNLGEPFKELARFVFLNGDEEDYLDINPSDLAELIAMVNSIGVSLPVSKRFEDYLESEEN